MESLHPMADRLANDLYDLFEPTLPGAWLIDPDFYVSDLALFLAAFEEQVAEKNLTGLALFNQVIKRANRYYSRELKTETHNVAHTVFYRFWLELTLLRITKAPDELIVNCYNRFDFMRWVASISYN